MFTSSTSKLKYGFVVAITTIAIVFAFLFFQERSRGPKEVVVEKIREVEKPVEVVKEVIKEVPVEVVKEIPGRLTQEQEEKLRLYDENVQLLEGFFNPKWFKPGSDALSQLNSISVYVLVDDSIKSIVSEETIKTKLELVLRQNKIPIDPKSPSHLTLFYNGIWTSDKALLSFTYELGLSEEAITLRKDGWRKFNGVVWSQRQYGHVGATHAEQSVLKNVQQAAENFANQFLSEREKEGSQKAKP